MYTAFRLRRAVRRGVVRVTVVDPRPVMTYQPFLPEAAAGSLEPRHVVVPLRAVLRGCRVITGRVTSIDPANHRAIVEPPTGDEYGVDYDHVVVALGSVARTLPIPGLAEQAIGFKHVEEAIALRNQVLGRLDVAASIGAASISADSTSAEAQRRRALTFVFVGGGYAGVEAFAELEDMARYATRYYANLEPKDMRWVLVEAAGRILPEVGEEMGNYTVEQLRSRSMEVLLHTRLESCVDGHVELSDGQRFDADTIVWTAGVKANPVVATTGLPLDEQGPDPVRCRPACRRVRRRLGGRRQRGRSRPLVEDPGCDLQPERAARRASGEGAGAKCSPGDRRRPTPGVPPSPRRFGGQPRAAQGRRSGVRHQGQGLSGVVHASHVPPLAGADPQPQGSGRTRLDPRVVLPTRGRVVGEPASSVRRVPPSREQLRTNPEPRRCRREGSEEDWGTVPEWPIPRSSCRRRRSCHSTTISRPAEGLAYARRAELGREATLSEVTASGLRGRGGGGFPTGDKWRSVRDAGGGRRYVVANGAEGEPATFKDRTLMRRDPFRIIEGAAIAAFVVGAADVYVATKRSFTRESENLRRAAVELGGAGLLGELTITIVEGPEEYLFGEEKALLEVIEGRDPLPRTLPPWQHGLFATVSMGWESGTSRGDDEPSSNPTVVNNVETLAAVAHVLAKGPTWYRTFGTPESPGTIVTTVVGDVQRPGVHEVALGTPFAELLERCGGPRRGRTFKAAFSGISNPVLTAG